MELILKPGTTRTEAFAGAKALTGTGCTTDSRAKPGALAGTGTVTLAGAAPVAAHHFVFAHAHGSAEALSRAKCTHLGSLLRGQDLSGFQTKISPFGLHLIPELI